MKTEDDQLALDRIAAYNEDDVRATRAVARLVGDATPGRDAVAARGASAVTSPTSNSTRASRRLHAFGSGTDEHLMGDLLGYWRRERRAVSADAYRLSIADEVDQLESQSAIAQLTFVGREQALGVNGQPLTWERATFTFPPQPVHGDIREGSKLIVAHDEQTWSFFEVADIDVDARRLDLKWKPEHDDRGLVPSALVHYDDVKDAPKPDALGALADELLDGVTDRVGLAILRRDVTEVHRRRWTRRWRFVPDEVSVCGWVTELDGASCRSKGRRVPARRTSAPTSSAHWCRPANGWGSRR